MAEVDLKLENFQNTFGNVSEEEDSQARGC